MACVQHAHKKPTPCAEVPRIIPLTGTAMAPKRKKQKPLVQRNIPAYASATITAHEFKQSTGSQVVATTTLLSSRPSTPLATATTYEPNNSAETQVYSDVDEGLLEKVEKTKRQRPSRSVNVRPVQTSPALSPQPTQPTGIVGGMASSIPGRIYG